MPLTDTAINSFTHTLFNDVHQIFYMRGFRHE